MFLLASALLLLDLGAAVPAEPITPSPWPADLPVDTEGIPTRP